MKNHIKSPAKVNLFLKVLSKRPDGYHNIVSIVDIISLYDVISIEELEDDVVIVNDDRGVLPEGQANTMYRAAMLLKERFNIHSGVKIFVEKHIPIGSGLGGPSSDAATVLKELIRMWELKISLEEVTDIGRKIGADVPLFLFCKPCVMRGTGEAISPVKLPLLWYLIVYPNMILSTKAVYEGLRIVLTKKENDIKLIGQFYSVHDIAGLLENDLETVAIPMCPTIKDLKDRIIKAGAIGALMSGSGSSVFGIFENEEGAKKGLLYLKDAGSVFIAHSI
ncbi:MAG: 4-(cytidine 5'-diphospho)-2-C-methyl-D-erythritol kinase [Deltaproteobacteria bacterium]